MSNMENYNLIMRLMDKATDATVLAFLNQRAAYYEKRLGLDS